MAKLHQIKIRLTAGGLGLVEIDGVDISNNVTKISFVARPGELNKIRIDLMGDVDLVAEGCDVLEGV